MKTMLGVVGTSLIVSLGLGGCGSDSSTAAAKKDIARVEVPDSPFKPADLEATIDGMVEAIADTEADTFSISVNLKEMDGYWEPVRVGANRAIAELELSGQVEAPVAPKEGDSAVLVDKQIELMTQRREDGYGGIGLAPHGIELDEEINLSKAAGIPVVTLDSDAPDSERDLYVGTNNTEAGKTAGETLAGLIEEPTGTVLIQGIIEQGWLDGYNRTHAAQLALEAAGYTVIVKQTGWSDDEVASDREEMPIMLADADPPAVGMIGMFSNAFRSAEVAKNAGYEPGELKIVGFDFEPETLSYMDEGYIQATHVQRQYYMGYMIPYVLYSLRSFGYDATADLLGDRLIKPHIFDTGLDVVAADQVDDYNNFLDGLGIGG